MIYCEKCGEELKYGANFCAKCGNNITGSGKREDVKSQSSFKADVRISHKNEVLENLLNIMIGIFNALMNGVKKIIIRSLKLLKPLMVLAMLGGVIMGIGYYYSEIYFSPQIEFEGIKISQTKSDIRLIKGLPDKEEDDFWVYSKYGYGELYVSFQGDAIKAIISSNGSLYSSKFIYDFFSMFDFEFGEYHCGYKDYDSVLRKFGTPSENTILDDQVTRRIKYDQYNILFAFVENRMSLCGIYNKSL